ncbi:MAG: PD-(D/E)XK nuclease family protein [Deltaproteobacteria bacterium]|jgi:CRISPR/Cas system-associated exonuclease Cas4 (RecB family)|nr:PD-(D/E)XK nuclease family protein [Deltaproteobacteria bacterium]MCL5880425.1 PD-(D/E)XK nuclease family protein [Deltaproteobacteria bacterium]MDA8303647.1 PD-(D/E)XK nuclease family protein [Deltaproteobacteria bacterium]
MNIYALSYKDFLLEYLADKLLEDINSGIDNGLNKDFSKYAVVFPGERPALYLRSILANKLESPYYPPAIFSLSEFIKFIAEKSSGPKAEINNINASWFLYNIVKNETDLKFFKETDRFEDFFLWGLQLLKTINELDAGLVDNESINKMKSYIAAIPENMSKFYNYLSIIRHRFHERLREENLTTAGLNYIEASKFLNNNAPKPLINEFEKIYFGGLIFLNRAESDIIKALINGGIAEFYTQFESLKEDEYLKDNIVVNLRKSLDKAEIVCITKTGAAVARGNEYDTSLFFYEGFDTHSELLAGNEIFDENNFDPQKNAVVLPDSNTLLPFLYHVMDYIDADYNITMGYPLRRTPLYSLIELIYKAQMSARSKTSAPALLANSKIEPEYRAKDYINLVKHPYIKTLGGIKTIYAINNIENLIVKNGDIFISLNEIENNYLINKGAADASAVNIIKAVHECFFKNFEDNKTTAKDFASNLIKIVNLITTENNDALKYKLSPEFTKKMIEAVNLFKDSYFNNEPVLKNSVFRLFKYYMDNESIAFNGIPLKGLQIMGILETRVLKFDRVAIFDASEDVLPQIEKFDPLLPYPVRKNLGLFTYNDYEALHRYHFRRLVFGAKEAHIVYIKNDKRIRSRFIEEIIWDEEKKAKKLDIEDKVKPLGFKTVISQESRNGENGFEIKKNDEILKILAGLIKKLSVSAIDTYINCPMQFYYRYIIRLEEIQEQGKRLGADKTGTFIHAVLKKFYEGIKENRYNFEQFIEIEGNNYGADYNTGRYLESALDSIIESPDIIEELEIDAGNGEFFLVKETAKKLLYNFIKKDLKSYDIGKTIWEILDLEAGKEAEFIIVGDKRRGTKAIKLYGIIDRIDMYKDIYKSKENNEEYPEARENENILIIDYKTGISFVKPDIEKILEYKCNSGGSLTGNISVISGIQDRSKIKELIKSFQLPVYLYLYKTEQGTHGYKNLNACINLITLDKKMGSKGHRQYLFDKERVDGADKDEIMEKIILPSLKNVIEEMLDKEKPFIPDNSDIKACEYCPYSLLCNKV